MGFKTMGKNQGDKVKAGDPIVEVDLKTLRNIYDMSTMLIVTNPSTRNITFLKSRNVKRGDLVAEVK